MFGTDNRLSQRRKASVHPGVKWECMRNRTNPCATCSVPVYMGGGKNLWRVAIGSSSIPDVTSLALTAPS